jgi:hypothetical protein
MLAALLSGYRPEVFSMSLAVPLWRFGKPRRLGRR